jgi:hypothetical protein
MFGHWRLLKVASIIDYIVFPQNSYIKALTSKVAIFGNKNFKEAIKFK